MKLLENDAVGVTQCRPRSVWNDELGVTDLNAHRA